MYESPGPYASSEMDGPLSDLEIDMSEITLGKKLGEVRLVGRARVRECVLKGGWLDGWLDG